MDCGHRDKRPRAVVVCVVLGSFIISTLPTFALSQTDSSWQLSESTPVDTSSNVANQQTVDSLIDEANENVAPTEVPEVTLEFDVVVTEDKDQKSITQQADVAPTPNELKMEKNGSDSEGGSLREPVSLVGVEIEPVAEDIYVEPIIEKTVSPIPVVDLTPEFRASLERQFLQIQQIEEEEDAFSDNLGESYLAYGKLLAQAGRLDEARDMYAKALHLAKINNGVYAIEQRPVLRALFDMHGAKYEAADMEKHLKQIIWLEKKNPDIRDAYTFDMIIRLGNLYIHQYYFEPKVTELALERINSAIRLFNYALNRYGDAPLTERVMPYGELALLQFIKSTINREIDRSFYEKSRFRQFTDIDKSPKARTGSNYLGNGLYHLKKYLIKAQKENNVEHQVRALRGIGDMYLLFNGSQQAARSYNLAWLKAAELDETHELVTSFDTPVRLPDFNYVSQREESISRDGIVAVPLNFDIDKYGRVGKIHTSAADAPEPKIVFRAKRISKRLKFRPMVENGKMIATHNFDYDIRVKLRSGERVAKVEELKANEGL